MSSPIARCFSANFKMSQLYRQNFRIFSHRQCVATNFIDLTNLLHDKSICSSGKNSQSERGYEPISNEQCFYTKLLKSLITSYNKSVQILPVRINEYFFYHNPREKYYEREYRKNEKNQGNKEFKNIFLLSGLAIVAALCEGPHFSKEKNFLRAAQYGIVHDLKKALSDGVDVNTRHPLGWTALQAAAINGKAEAVKFLLKNGADPNAGDEFVNVYKTAMEKGLHSLDVLVKREEEFSDCLNNRATFKGFTALHYAVLADSKECIKALLDGGANPTIENESGHRAIDHAREGEIKDLLEERARTYDELMREKIGRTVRKNIIFEICGYLSRTHGGVIPLILALKTEESIALRPTRRRTGN